MWLILFLLESLQALSGWTYGLNECIDLQVN